MPTPERARELGFDVRGQSERCNLWLMGVAFALPAIESNFVFKMEATSPHFVSFSTDSIPLFQEIWQKWKPYGIICEQIGGRICGADIDPEKPLRIE